MAKIMELINFFDPKSKEYEEFLQELMVFNGDIPLDVEEVDSVHSTVITAVNSRLNQASTRYSGLVILEKVLPQCSKEVLLKYCVLWLSKATQVLENVHSTPQDLTQCCKIIGQLIIHSKRISEIQKQVSMQNVKQLINVISTFDSERQTTAVYYLIAVLLHQYPEVCERFQVPIRKMILVQLDSTESSLIDASAKCYALLTKATERSFKPPPTKLMYTSWVYHQVLICNSLHAIMDELFSGLIELESVDIWDKLDLPNISETNIIQFYTQQRQRFSNLCHYLSSMLCGYGIKNSVSPNDILKVLCRGLAIRPTNLKRRNTFKEQILYLILPKLHIDLLNVLDAFIKGFKEQLVPFGTTILQLFHQTLQWTETVVENQTTISGNKPFKHVRISVYKCLSSWLMNTNSLSGIETVADEYLPSILKDIVPERDRVLLTIQKTQNLSKRALKRLRDSQYEKSAYLNNGATPKKQSSLDTDICKEALVSLQNVFLSGGFWLKQTVFKTVQNIVVPLLYDCYLSSSEQKFYKDSISCRLELLRVLRIIQMNSHSLTPPPTQYSIELFEMALNDVDLHIIQEAKIALAELEKVMHPSAPTLLLAQAEETQEEFVADNQDRDKSMEVTNLLEINREVAMDDDMVPSLNKRPKIHSAVEKTLQSVVEKNLEDKVTEMQANPDTKNQEDTTQKNNSIPENEKSALEEDQETNISNDNENSDSATSDVAMTDTVKPMSTLLPDQKEIKEKIDQTEEPTESIVENENIELILQESEDTAQVSVEVQSAMADKILELFTNKTKDDV